MLTLTPQYIAALGIFQDGQFEFLYYFWQTFKIEFILQLGVRRCCEFTDLRGQIQARLMLVGCFQN